ncbi:MAG: acetyl-CoA carboxylase biotin carboxylase subunit [Acidobacteriota bacterium]|jgi:propionyl-CoA carboxylase alpha chain|nr:acetyl-CoA carboxylase biotin carboxylase subunit [Acidobacteriota bacterium]
MFKKILIANRGEIACRIIKTARKMGIATVAVYSDADRDALHVEMADEAVCIGPAPSRDSYLVMDKIVAACKETGAEAVHPGYGFLSENGNFARRLEEAGVKFIGPSADALDRLGDKIASKKLARKVGLPAIPGYGETVANTDEAVLIARSIGYPVMLKASAGGGGKGLRVAWNDEEIRERFVSCVNEARNAFDDDRVFLEKFIEGPRHIEFQILGDSHGNMIHLNERECSVQRRHQKVLEEAPSPFIDGETRKKMGEQAVALAAAVRYESAGTVEFIVDRDKNFYFLEMNARLQVEHPVTEFITDVDLVEQMIRIAAGERLPFTQDDVGIEGWAMECRINAEDPFRNFLPSTGRLTSFMPPPDSDSVRVDAGVVEGDTIPVYYDSMIAKLITHGRNRADAISIMRDALNAFVIRGVRYNIPFQAALIQHPRFLSGDFTTGLIAEEFPHGFDASMAPYDDPALFISVAAFVHRCWQDRAAKISGQMPGHERRVGDEWVVLRNGERHPVVARPCAGGYEIEYGAGKYEILSYWRLGQLLFHGTCNGEPFTMQVERHRMTYQLFRWGSRADMIVMSARAAELLAMMPQKTPPDLSGFLLSPMPGLLREIAVTVGMEVRQGEKLAVVEAMKMENILRAERDCKIKGIVATVGENLAVDQVIIEFE